MFSSNDFFSTLRQIWAFELIHIEGSAVTVGSICVGIAAIAFGFWLAKRLSRQISRVMITRFSVDRPSVDTVEVFSFYVFVVLFSFFGLSIANIPMTVFTVAGGALAIGVGFGSQNVMNNFISGLILLIEQPIRVDDYIEVDGIFGRVQRIGFRSTTVLALGNRQLIVPNSSLLEKNVLNWTLSDRIIRTQVNIGVAYGSAPRKVEGVLLEAVRETEGVLEFPQPTVLFKDFAESSLVFEVTFSLEIHELRDRESVSSDLRFKIAEKFQAAGIVMPFPQRDIHLSTDSPIDVRVYGETRTDPPPPTARN